MAKDLMLTTTDNPYDPFDDFDRWFAFDTQHGYNTCGLVARISATSPEFSDAMQVKDIEEAIDVFIANDPLKRFVKVVRN